MNDKSFLANEDGKTKLLNPVVFSFSNKEPTKTEIQMFKNFGLYLIEKGETVYKYAPIYTECKEFPKEINVRWKDVESGSYIEYYLESNTFYINKLAGDLELLTLIKERADELFC